MNRKAKALNRINNALDKAILPENQEDLTNLICYLRVAKLSEYDQEFVRRDLTEMVLAAQQRGEGIRSVIGEDYKAFCDDIIASLPARTRSQKVLAFLDTLCLSLSILGAVSLLFADGTLALLQALFARQPLHPEISITLSTVALTGMILVIASALVMWICKKSLQPENHGRQFRRKAFLLGAGWMAVCLLVTWFGRGVLFTAPIWAVCAVIILLYAAHRVLDNLEL